MMTIDKTMNIQGRYATGKDIKNVINFIQYAGESESYRAGMVDTLRTLNLITVEQQRELLDSINKEV